MRIFAEIKILALQNPQMKILSLKNTEFKILGDFMILAVFKVLAFQNPEWNILADLQMLAFQTPLIQDFGWPLDFSVSKS